MTLSIFISKNKTIKTTINIKDRKTEGSRTKDRENKRRKKIRKKSEIENKINEALSGDIDLDVCVLLRMLNEKLGGKNG